MVRGVAWRMVWPRWKSSKKLPVLVLIIRHYLVAFESAWCFLYNNMDKKTDGMMDKKDSMSKDNMKK